MKHYAPGYGHQLRIEDLPADMREQDGDLIPAEMQRHVQRAVQMAGAIAPFGKTSEDKDLWLSFPLSGPNQTRGANVDYEEWMGQWSTGFGRTPDAILAALPPGLDRERCRERSVHARYWTESGADAASRGVLFVELRVRIPGRTGGEPERLGTPDHVLALAADVIEALHAE